MVKVTHRWTKNSELGPTLEWVGAGVGYSMGVGWFGKKRDDCSRMSSGWNGAYSEGLLEIVFETPVIWGPEALTETETG